MFEYFHLFLHDAFTFEVSMIPVVAVIAVTTVIAAISFIIDRSK